MPGRVVNWTHGEKCLVWLPLNPGSAEAVPGGTARSQLRWLRSLEDRKENQLE